MSQRCRDVAIAVARVSVTHSGGACESIDALVMEKSRSRDDRVTARQETRLTSDAIACDFVDESA